MEHINNVSHVILDHTEYLRTTEHYGYDIYVRKYRSRYIYILEYNEYLAVRAKNPS